MCQQPFGQLTLLKQPEHGLLLRMLHGLVVRCHLAQSGCNWTGPRGNLETHLRVCPFHPCPLAEQGCKWAGPPAAAAAHTKDDCPFSIQGCPHPGCEVELPRSQLAEHAGCCPIGQQLAAQARALKAQEAERAAQLRAEEEERAASVELDAGVNALFRRRRVTIQVGKGGGGAEDGRGMEVG